MTLRHETQTMTWQANIWIWNFIKVPSSAGTGHVPSMMDGAALATRNKQTILIVIKSTVRALSVRCSYLGGQGSLWRGPGRVVRGTASPLSLGALVWTSLSPATPPPVIGWVRPWVRSGDGASFTALHTAWLSNFFGFGELRCGSSCAGGCLPPWWQVGFRRLGVTGFAGSFKGQFDFSRGVERAKGKNIRTHHRG